MGSSPIFGSDMAISSHRLKIEEKKVLRRLVASLVILVVSIIILIYAGIPLLAKTIIFFTSNRLESITTNVSNTTLISPPVLDSLAEATNSSVISISGMAEKESTVKIFVNAKEAVKVMADRDAKFIAKNLKLSEGTNTVVAVTLKDNQESSPSGSLTIVFKKNPPKLDISSPTEGQKFIAESKDTAISGETDPGNKITVNDRFVIVDSYGKFNYKVTLSDGDNNFRVVATDIAGNQTIVERKVNFTP